MSAQVQWTTASEETLFSVGSISAFPFIVAFASGPFAGAGALQ